MADDQASKGDAPETNGKEATKAEVTPELENSIIRQIEYYFGDVNLPRDKFLKEQVQLDEGWVLFTTMLKFKRLSNLSQDVDVIINALKKSETQLLEISEDKTKLRRSPEFPLPELNEERRKELMSRTIYAKGFPKDSTTVDTCLDFFKQYNNPEDIVLRRYQDRVSKQWAFKGSVFVTFRTKEHAESFLAETSVKFNDVDLERKWQSVYLEEKRALFDKYKKSGKKDQQKQEESHREPIKLPTGTVLILSNVTEDLNRNNIKDAVSALGGEVGYVKIEDGKAWVRLQKEDTAKGVFEKCTGGKIKIESADFECSLLEGEEEKKFLEEMADELTKRRQKPSYKMNKNRGGGKPMHNRKRRGGGEGGPGGKRGR